MQQFISLHNCIIMPIKTLLFVHNWFVLEVSIWETFQVDEVTAKLGKTYTWVAMIYLTQVNIHHGTVWNHLKKAVCKKKPGPVPYELMQMNLFDPIFPRKPRRNTAIFNAVDYGWWKINHV